MNCPNRQVEMQQGQFAVQGTALNLTLTGAGFHDYRLSFKPKEQLEDQKRKQRVLGLNRHRSGHLCPQCGASVISGPDK